jgi:hypothetical protein
VPLFHYSINLSRVQCPAAVLEREAGDYFGVFKCPEEKVQSLRTIIEVVIAFL